MEYTDSHSDLQYRCYQTQITCFIIVIIETFCLLTEVIKYKISKTEWKGQNDNDNDNNKKRCSSAKSCK